MRILVDYRPALRARSGVGEYIHELIRAYARTSPDTVGAFTSSWKDRPPPDLAATLHARIIDRRVPVSLLNYLWHRLEWPPVEWLAGRWDVVHAAHPLLIPSQHAARVVTIHDLFFLTHPERTSAEIRRDYAALAGTHARRADAVITSTEHGKRLVASTFAVPGERIYVCAPGAPRWATLGRRPHRPAGGYVLFVGTLEPRKNIGVLLDAWERLLAQGGTAGSRLMIAGRATAESAGWLHRMRTAPLSGSVTYRGYVPADQREALYAGAHTLVLPSLDEGFGLTVLEAMSAGIAVVASNRGSLPEVAGDAAALVDPTSPEQLADALARAIHDPAWGRQAAEAGLERAARFTWERAATTLACAYADAVARRGGQVVQAVAS